MKVHCAKQEFLKQTIHFIGCKDKDYLNLMAYYATTIVEKKEEYFLYDLMTLLSSLGGTMGLLLGYSLLSIILSMINFLERYILDALLARK